MGDRNFRQMLEAQWSRGNFVCVGLDSEFGKIPKESYIYRDEMGTPYLSQTIARFNRHVVNATKDLVCAFKPNAAFYEAWGDEGWEALKKTVEHIHDVAPDVPVILDAKRADIGNTNNGYVQMLDAMDIDAITVHPYLGAEALKPFLDRADKGIIVLCKTSNPGAGEFQDLGVTINADTLQGLGPYGSRGVLTKQIPFYQYVAHRVATQWDNESGNCGLVVGATYPEELRGVRLIVGNMPILIPGVGFQQKDVPLEEQVKQVVSAGKDSRGWGMIINSSRGIIFASKGADFAEAARRETEKLHNLINQYRQ